jgi:cholinesterase
MRSLLLLLTVAPLLAQPPADQKAPPRIARLYVFGDSYSDTGAGYEDGNGPTAVAYFARRLGFELKPANQSGSPSDSLNFAVSGAQTGRGAGHKVKDALLDRGMMDQVDDFVARVHARQVIFDSKTTLFFLAGGLNDRMLPAAESVANLEAEIHKLYEAGARRFRVAILPTAIPAFREVGLRLNPELRGIPAAIQAQLPDVHIALSHWGGYFDEVMNNPSQYGIENTTDPCAGRAIFNEGTTPCSKPSTYYYFHAGHPSTAVHKAVGDKLYEEFALSQ